MAIDECSAFIQNFTTKGFLRNMWNQSVDQRNLTILDKKVSSYPKRMLAHIFMSFLMIIDHCSKSISTDALSFSLIIINTP